MKLRTVYFKVMDMNAAVSFWEKTFQISASKKSNGWSEFDLGNVRFGLLLNDFGSVYTGANGAVMFEFSQNEFDSFMKRAQENGAKIIDDQLNNPALRSIILQDPFGHEFECGLEGTHH